jgi:hydrogenase-4 component E
MLAAMFIIVNRKKVITHVLGYMIFENGIFLLSLSMAGEMPIIVDLGVMLDLFVGIFLLGIFVNAIHQKESANL